MAKDDPPRPSGETNDPYEHPRKLAEKMVRALKNEDATTASIAAAILIAGVVASYAEDAGEARELLEGIHGLSERFVQAWLNDETERWAN
jgi:hypothetical protein